jgi:hypothetical protein
MLNTQHSKFNINHQVILRAILGGIVCKDSVSKEQTGLKCKNLPHTLRVPQHDQTLEL